MFELKLFLKYRNILKINHLSSRIYIKNSGNLITLEDFFPLCLIKKSHVKKPPLVASYENVEAVVSTTDNHTYVKLESKRIL